MRYVLAHDLGTTGDKASLVDEAGRLVGSSFAGYRTSYPHAGWAEQSPEDWWRAFVASTLAVLHDTRVPANEVACVVFSGQMMGMVAVDADARPLRDAIIWADQRATDQVGRVGERVDPRRVYAITGHRLSPSYSAAKMAWLKDADPELFARAHAFLQPKDFLVATLTGVLATDHSDASGTNLYDLRAGSWSGELLEAFELPAGKLPPIYRSTDVVGEVRPAAAEEAGLRAGTPVVMGGGDGCCATTGAGVVREEAAYNYIGASSWIALATREPILDPEMRTFTFAHLIPGMFSPCGAMQAAGASYQWALNQLAPTERVVAERLGVSPYELMNGEVRRSPAGARGLLFLPYLLGERSPRWNPNARGAFIGLTARHEQADLLRAVLEGITFNLRVILEAFQRQGAAIEALRIIGGGAQSDVWNQIMADIFGVPVVRLALAEEATSLGAAVAGGVGVGIWKDFSQVDEMVALQREVRPDPATQTRYAELYAIFEQIYRCLEGGGIFDRLASLDEA